MKPCRWRKTLMVTIASARRLNAVSRKQVIGAVRARFNPETDFAIVEGQLFWHIGVVGIVASRVLQQFYRPTFIIGGEGSDNWRGSGRSIAGFDLAAALRECSDLLVKHGGHAMAAGVTIHPENLDAFRTRLNEIARPQLKIRGSSAAVKIGCRGGVKGHLPGHADRT